MISRPAIDKTSPNLEQSKKEAASPKEGTASQATALDTPENAKSPKDGNAAMLQPAFPSPRESTEINGGLATKTKGNDASPDVSGGRENWSADPSARQEVDGDDEARQNPAASEGNGSSLVSDVGLLIGWELANTAAVHNISVIALDISLNKPYKRVS